MNKLQKIKIDNFKSLVDFEINFSKFNCIIGLNGSGKSTLLQALDFISRQIKGDISKWLKTRNWSAKDLSSKFTNKKNISFSLFLEIDNVQYRWESVFSVTKLRCINETIEDITNNQVLVKVEKSKYKILKKDGYISGDIVQEYEGSILSSLKEDILPSEIIKIKKFIKNITSLDLLSPQSLRQRSRSDGKELGLGGEHLTSFLYYLKEKDELVKLLKNYYQNLIDFNIIKSKNGWKRLEIIECFDEKNIITEAKHINDGFLRIITIIAQLFTNKDFLLLDEIENGINPELIEFLVDSLVNSKHQVLVTTHSPMILNYIEDDVAIESVFYIYKNKTGITKVIRFFELPQMREKLEVMGPGEV